LQECSISSVLATSFFDVKAFLGYLLLPRMLCLTFYPGRVMACGGHPFWVEAANREQAAVEYNRQQPATSGH
jgi:hypothetical protein